MKFRIPLRRNTITLAEIQRYVFELIIYRKSIQIFLNFLEEGCEKGNSPSIRNSKNKMSP